MFTVQDLHYKKLLYVLKTEKRFAVVIPFFQDMTDVLHGKLGFTTFLQQLIFASDL